MKQWLLPNRQFESCTKFRKKFEKNLLLNGSCIHLNDLKNRRRLLTRNLPLLARTWTGTAGPAGTTGTAGTGVCAGDGARPLPFLALFGLLLLLLLFCAREGLFTNLKKFGSCGSRSPTLISTKDNVVWFCTGTRNTVTLLCSFSL